jgi:hypothetical protein
VGAPNKNRIASELIAQLQGVAQDAWAVEIDQLIALFKFEIKAKDGEACRNNIKPNGASSTNDRLHLCAA